MTEIDQHPDWSEEAHTEICKLVDRIEELEAENRIFRSTESVDDSVWDALLEQIRQHHDRIEELEHRLEAVREIAIEGIRAWEYDSQDISMKLCEALGESLVTGCDPLHFAAIGEDDE